MYKFLSIRSLLSGMMSCHAALLPSTRDVNHWVIRLILTISQCLCSSNPCLLNNGPKVKE